MKRSLNTWAWAGACGVGLAIVLGTIGGCKRHGSGTVVVPDPGPARYSDAVRLADEAEKARKAGETDKAIALYQQSMAKEPLALVCHNLGMLYLERGDRMAAVELLSEAANLDQSRPTPHYNMGLIYADNAQPDKALEHFKAALERDKLYLPALRGCAKVGRMLVVSDEESLERMKTALLLEKDAAWRRIFEEEKLRIDGALQTAARTGKF